MAMVDVDAGVVASGGLVRPTLGATLTERELESFSPRSDDFGGLSLSDMKTGLRLHLDAGMSSEHWLLCEVVRQPFWGYTGGQPRPNYVGEPLVPLIELKDDLGRCVRPAHEIGLCATPEGAWSPVMALDLSH